MERRAEETRGELWDVIRDRDYAYYIAKNPAHRVNSISGPQAAGMVPKGLCTWREGAPANRATRLTELLGEG